MDRVHDNAELLKQLKDMSHEFSKVELESVIQEQFFNDSVSLNDAVVDAAITRLLILDRILPDKESMEKRRAMVMADVFKQILICSSENDVKPQ